MNPTSVSLSEIVGPGDVTSLAECVGCNLLLVRLFIEVTDVLQILLVTVLFVSVATILSLLLKKRRKNNQGGSKFKIKLHS